MRSCSRDRVSKRPVPMFQWQAESKRHWCIYLYDDIFVPPFLPRPPPSTHTDRKHPNSERTWTAIPHRLHPCIFKEPKLPDTPIHRPFAQKGLWDGGKAKEQVSSHLCSTKAAVHWWPRQLYGQFAQESSKKPLWEMKCGGRLSSWADRILLK